jgi:WD40 repeat protein
MKLFIFIVIFFFFFSGACRKFDFSNPVDTSISLHPPDEFRVAAMTETSVHLVWKDLNTYTAEQRAAVQIQIELRTDSTEFSVVSHAAFDSATATFSGKFSSTSIYYFRARFSAGQNVSEYSTVFSSKFSLPAPENVLVACYADTAMKIQWSTTDTSVVSFDIERSINKGSFTVWKTVLKETTEIFYKGILLNNTEYAFRVRSHSQYNTSGYSAVAQASVTLDPPSSLSFQHLSNNAVTVDWMDNSSFEKYFIVERKSFTGEYDSIAAVSANVTTYSDYTLNPSEEYEYRICARSTVNISDPSTVLKIKYTVKNAEVSRILSGHTGSVYASAVHPVGTMFATGGADKIIRVWSSDGTLLKTLEGHGGEVYALAFTPNGQWLVSGSLDKTVKVWSVSTGKLQFTLTGHSSAVYSVSASPDNKTIASAGFDKNICLWDISTGQLIQTITGHTQSVYAVTFSPHGTLLATAGGDRTIKVWNVSDGSLVWNLTGHGNNIFGLAFHPDGTTLLSGSYDNSIRVWNLSDGSLVRIVQRDSNSISSLALSADARILVSGNTEEKINVWDAETFSLLQSSYAHTDVVTTLAVDPLSHWFVSGGGDGLVKMWSVANEWVKQ